MLLLVLIILLAYWLYAKFIRPLSYWKDRGVPYSYAYPVFGMMWETIRRKKAFYYVCQDLYNKHAGKRYHGVFSFGVPSLVIKDLDLIKQITVKDFDYFTDHLQNVDENVDPLFGKNLVSLKGDRWRDMRATLSPVFTSRKMKAMFPLIVECAENVTSHFMKMEQQTVDLEMKEAFSRFTNDVIASVAFGIKCDSLADKENVFFKMGQDITNIGGLRSLKFMIMTISKTLTKVLRLRIAPESSDFFESIVAKTMKTREELNISRPDMLQLMMEAKKGRLQYEEEDHSQETDTGFATVKESAVGKVENRQKPPISNQDIASQALLFFFAGFETSSTVMSFLAYELAINPDVQEKLQREIDGTLKEYDGVITYDTLLKLKYLDMVLCETLRLWPAAGMTDRLCVKEYTIEPKEEGEIPVKIEVGKSVMIPFLGLHRDPKYFPNPTKFDPERFSDENKSNIRPYSYLPFGVGPRNCIASRFAILEVKILIFHLLAKFDLVATEKTPIPLILSAKKFNMVPDDGFLLGLQRRKHIQDE